MPSFSVRMNAESLAQLNKRITKLLQDAEHMEPVWQQAAEYMVRSTQNRINKTQTSPSGERWAGLAALTIKLKGTDWPLYATGKLVGGIHTGEIDNHGFQVVSDAPYSSYVQDGVKNSRGKYKKKTTPHSPARPFMGFSAENARRISKMIRDHLKAT
ncbi:hypothetical protein BDS110ZK4_27240 [Bradyrhizobium diazoefficiens]|uniref:Phage virion morphogenesis protein n=2 Tax=Bradyrhizobium TaxID=374 RepID=A0A809X5A8_9BRAD|nr:hypothetical protein XF1B_48700 [Bradyrhizobium diazoefficiens]BCE48454.1 hypothetical protein XF4B_48030 [Bradyrhizobium diazoefficiens]BCE91970.1 hypothetical protein XF10B_47680 [Bradyrhizobium diazoefficiens]BCF26898.1 hypothetical protein XF14B_48500 [Bradyrhizobium diazoefficiens]